VDVPESVIGVGLSQRGVDRDAVLLVLTAGFNQQTIDAGAEQVGHERA
jgi:hypothetical protein